MPTKHLRITIPEGVSFDALHLSRNPSTGMLRFAWRPIEQVCAASGIDISFLREQDEANISGLLMAWYMAHKEQGGNTDPVMEQVIAEASAELQHGEDRVQRGSELKQ